MALQLEEQPAVLVDTAGLGAEHGQNQLVLGSELLRTDFVRQAQPPERLGQGDDRDREERASGWIAGRQLCIDDAAVSCRYSPWATLGDHAAQRSGLQPWAGG